MIGGYDEIEERLLEEKMGFSDLHIHSLHSYDGTASIPAILKYASSEARLNVIAITDHDTMSGVAEAMDLAPKYNLEVIPGCEVASKDGHVLCLFIKRPVPAGLSLLETVLRTGEQGGLCVAAHPMAKAVNSLRFETIRTVLRNPEASKILVGVEAYNGGLVYTRRNAMVESESLSLPLAQLGDSDAHILRMIGQGASWFDGNTAEELKTAILNHRTIPRRGHGLTGAAVVTSYIPNYLLRKLGWVSWNASPESAIRLANMSKIKAVNPAMAQAFQS
jgi:predicted metal-dependent phosphoesterase TrpH